MLVDKKREYGINEADQVVIIGTVGILEKTDWVEILKHIDIFDLGIETELTNGLRWQLEKLYYMLNDSYKESFKEHMQNIDEWIGYTIAIWRDENKDICFEI